MGGGVVCLNLKKGLDFITLTTGKFYPLSIYLGVGANVLPLKHDSIAGRYDRTYSFSNF